MAVVLSRYRLRLAAVAVVFLLSTPSSGQDPAQLALERALRLADVYNWSDAAPFFAEAERLFANRGDTRNAFYALVGLIRGTMEQRSLPEISNWLANELSANELLQTEDELRLFCLIVKGDIEGELDAGPMRRDWQAVLQLAEKLGNQKWANRASGEIGFAAFLEGDLAEARKLVAGTLMHASKTGDVGAQIRYLAAIGTGLVLTRSPSESLPYFEKAAGLSKQHGDVGYPFLVHEGRVMALKALGRLADARVEADEVLHQARSRQKHVKECQVLITSARISLADNEYDRAASELGQAIKLAEAGGFKRLLADAHAVLADVYIAKGDVLEAETTASIAADLTQSSGELYLVPGRLELVARIKVLRGKHTEGDQVYRHAADFVDAMLANAPPAAKTSLIVAMSDIYAGHFALAADRLNRPALAFEIVERARGRVATDLIRSGMRETPEQAREVERQISALHLQLTRAKTRAEVRQLRNRIFLAEQSRWVLPNTWRDQVHKATPIKLADLQRKLKPKDMLLEYVLADPASFCLTVTRDQVRIVTLPARSKIEPLINDYVHEVKAKRSAGELGQRLYRTLLAGVPGLRTHTRLIVVGDGYLHLLPFDSLPDPAGRFLVRTHTVTTATSATAFYLQGDDGQLGLDGGSLLAVGGIPYETGTTPKIALFRRGSDGALGNLPSSEDEAFAAAEAMTGLDSIILTGRKATEAAFKQAVLERRRAIHLAVHGIADQSHPDRAGLVMLSSPSAQEDGILHGSEIVQLRLNADLVVLSACDTAVGRLLGQEGIGTLSRAFQLAGARSVASTLWSTDDTFSLNLMKRFYARIARGETLAAALTGAKRDLLNEFGTRAVPYYWAGFVLSGAADRPLITVGAKSKETYAAH